MGQNSKSKIQIWRILSEAVHVSQNAVLMVMYEQEQQYIPYYESLGDFYTRIYAFTIGCVQNR